MPQGPHLCMMTLIVDTWAISCSSSGTTCWASNKSGGTGAGAAAAATRVLKAMQTLALHTCTGVQSVTLSCTYVPHCTACVGFLTDVFSDDGGSLLIQRLQHLLHPHPGNPPTHTARHRDSTPQHGVQRRAASTGCTPCGRGCRWGLVTATLPACGILAPCCCCW